MQADVICLKAALNASVQLREGGEKKKKLIRQRFGSVIVSEKNIIRVWAVEAGSAGRVGRAGRVSVSVKVEAEKTFPLHGTGSESSLSKN